jgi:hypothetical protein
MQLARRLSRTGCLFSLNAGIMCLESRSGMKFTTTTRRGKTKEQLIRNKLPAAATRHLKKVERITHPIVFTVYFCAICIKQRSDFSFAGNIAINTCKKPSRNTMQLAPLFAPTLRSVERTGAK